MRDLTRSLLAAAVAVLSLGLLLLNNGLGSASEHPELGAGLGNVLAVVFVLTGLGGAVSGRGRLAAARGAFAVGVVLFALGLVALPFVHLPWYDELLLPFSLGLLHAFNGFGIAAMAGKRSLAHAAPTA